VSALHHARLVATREISERVLSRAFALSTLAVSLVVVAAIVIPALGQKTPRVNVGLAGTTPAALPAAMRGAARAANTRVVLHRFANAASGETALRHGDVRVLVVDGKALVWKAEEDSRTSSIVTAAIRQVAVVERAAALGLSGRQVQALLASPVAVHHLQAPDPHRDSRRTIAMVGFLVLLVTLVWYGSAVAQGVAQEKGDRVMEVLLSRVDPRALLAGKVVGIGIVGLAQLAVAAAAGVIAILAVKTIDVPTAVPAALGSALLWFVLGFAFWSVLFAAVGASVSRAEDLQAALAPLSWFLLLCALTGPVAGNDPDAWYSQVASIVPLTAPFAMPARIAVSSVAPWEIALAVGLTVAFTYAVVGIAARVYSGGLLQSGTRLHARDLWQAARRA
jgi:ABC-2 type transport system permease protein